MHSFNYDEQANQLQQQILSDQDYTSESVTADYNPDSESSTDTRKQNDVHVNEEFIYSIDGIKQQSENNIDNEETTYQVNQATYFDKMADTSDISTKFYTTLPNREAAEKLAALAAAGHVNSRLINQLQKQQQEEDRQKNSMPLNHKDNDDLEDQQQMNDDEHMYNQQKLHHKSQHDNGQNFKDNDKGKLSLQITIPDEKDDYITSDDDQQSDTKRDNVDIEYEYEDGEIEDPQSTVSFKMTSHNNSYAEFGTRLYS